MLKHKFGGDSPYVFALIITLVCISLFYLQVDDLLAYQRQLILEGQWWRLLSGNLLHTNAWHLYMNLAGLWVIVSLHKPHYDALRLGILFCVLCVMQGLGLLLFYPTLIGYVGLSGMLHGLFTYGAVMDIRQGLKSGYLLLLGVILKVAYEQFFGASSEMTQLINARVATEAHLVGLVSGLICVSALFAFKLMAYKHRS